MSNSVTFQFNLNVSVPASQVPQGVPVQVSVSLGKPMLTSEWEEQQRQKKEQQQHDRYVAERAERLWQQEQRQEQARLDEEERRWNRIQDERRLNRNQERKKLKHNWKKEGF